MSWTKQIEKRVKRQIRERFKKNQIILVKDNLSFYFLSRFLSSFPIKIKRKAKRYDYFVSSQTAEDLGTEFLKNFFQKKLTKKEKKEINLLSCLKEEEAVRFAKIKKIKFQRKRKDKEILSFLNQLEKNHPEIKHSLIKSINFLENLSKDLKNNL